MHLRLGYREAEAAVWDSLGHINQQLGDHPQVTEYYEHSLVICPTRRPVQHRRHLNGFGDAYHAGGGTGAARAAWEEALTILTDLDHPDADGIRAKLSQ